MHIMRQTIAKIYMSNLQHNLQEIKSHISLNTKLCIAVKADAYGHGAVACAKQAVGCGADYLAVATVSEGVELRQNGISLPILVLSLCTPEEMSELVAAGLTPLVFDSEYISLVADAVKKAGLEKFSVHIAVDTGMGRIGCLPEDAAKIAQHIVDTKVLYTGGMCTHFAVADSSKPDDRAYTAIQFSRFMTAVANVQAAGIDPGIRHCANSAALLDHPEMQLDMVRAGIIVYGYYPGDLDEAYFIRKGSPVSLRPVMAFSTRVVAVRSFDSGDSVSYGRTWTAQEPTHIGVLPAGYADGVYRRFVPGLTVAVDGKSYPVRGRICMDQCMIDLGPDTAVKRWSEAVFFGPKESGALQTAQDIADQTGTISYEITSAVSKRVPRIYC
jgi:alanine racemase